MSTYLGRYRLDQRLGGGGMAEVFLGSSVGAEGFSRRVAIKRVLPGFSENPAFARMFIDEARISSRLVHPNIVSVVDFDRDADGRLYLVMELVDGRDLDGLATTGQLPIAVVIFVISEVLRGLGHAHDLPVVDDAALHQSSTLHAMRGIVHRDVSPHNVLLSWEGAVKVSDFGIAKARSASAATASEFIKGKPAYMSPEQANGESLDGRSDLFAVGVMMWELLVGRRLFVGQDTRTTLAAVLFGQIPLPRKLRGDIPKNVERVVMKLLERDLPSRYATAEAAIKDLLDCGAAPRDGRELLKTTLAERFPTEAPIRHSVLRSRGNAPASGPVHDVPPQAPPPSTQPGYGDPLGAPHAATVPPHLAPTYQPQHLPTAADGAAGRPIGPVAATRPYGPTPHGALPSIGALRGAHTSTLPPPAEVGPAARPLPYGRRKRGTLALVIAAAIAAAAVAVAVVMALGNGPSSPKTDRIARGSSLAPADAALAAEPAAAVVTLLADAAVAEPAVDAGDAARGEAKKDATAVRPSDKKGMGRLLVRAFPVLTVYVDNKKIRDTPVDMPLTAGKHKIRLVSSEGKDELVTVTIEENKTTTIDRN